MERGAVVDAVSFSDTAGARDVDVMFTYKGDAGYMSAKKRPRSRRPETRGGLIAIHDTICRTKSGMVWASTLWVRKSTAGATHTQPPVAYAIADPAHPSIRHDHHESRRVVLLMTWAKSPQIRCSPPRRRRRRPSARGPRGRSRAADLDLKRATSRRETVSRVRVGCRATTT